MRIACVGDKQWKLHLGLVVAGDNVVVLSFWKLRRQLWCGEPHATTQAGAENQ